LALLKEMLFRQGWRRARGRAAATGYQSRDTPSESLGGALRGNIREILPAAHRHSISVAADASALIDKLRSYARVDVPKWL
jgi:hypothetical protein